MTLPDSTHHVLDVDTGVVERATSADVPTPSEIVLYDTGEVVKTRLATAEQLRTFAVAVRDRLGGFTQDELGWLEAVLLAVARRLKQLGKDAGEADRSRVLALRRIGDLLVDERGGDRRSEEFQSSENGTLNQAERKSRHASRLLAEFADLVDAELAKDAPISLSRLMKLCQRRRSQAVEPLADSTRTFSILYADPPWQYDFAADSDGRQIENHYGTMTLKAIKDLSVPAADDAVLFCWATSPKLLEALQVLEAWGFTYKTNMVWVKDKIGMGYYARQQHELLLIGTRGELPTPAPENRPSSVVYGDRTEHSVKPDTVYDLIETMYLEYGWNGDTTEFCELFQRRPRKGWHGWGNDL